LTINRVNGSLYIVGLESIIIKNMKTKINKKLEAKFKKFENKLAYIYQVQKIS